MVTPTAEQVVFDVLDGAGSAVLAVDETGLIRYCNARALEVFGYAEEELIGQAVEVLVPQERSRAHARERERYADRRVARGMDRHVDLRGVRKDGTEFEADITLTPWTTSGGHWVIATVFDVSHRREAEKRVQEQSQGYLMLAKVNQAVAVAEDVADLYQRVCNDAVVYGNLLGAWVLERDETGIRIRGGAGPLAARLAVARAEPETAAASNGEADETSGDTPKGTLPDVALLEAMTADEPVFINDLAEVPEVGRSTAELLGVHSFAALPLHSRGRRVATLCLCSTREGVFTKSMHSLLHNAADTISLGLERLEARAELDRALAHRTDLLRRLVDAQERERALIAGDVHDEPVQSMAAVDLRLGLLRKRAEKHAPMLVPDVETIHDIVTVVSRQLRHLLFQLEPVEPGTTLTELLDEAARHVFELSPVTWRIENEPDPHELELSPELRTIAVRIAKEALTNVRKHAQAESVRARVDLADGGVAVHIADDGVGIPAGVHRSPSGHRGLSGMADRASAAGGRLSIEPTTPGTAVSFWLPRD